MLLILYWDNEIWLIQCLFLLSWHYKEARIQYLDAFKKHERNKKVWWVLIIGWEWWINRGQKLRSNWDLFQFYLFWRSSRGKTLFSLSLFSLSLKLKFQFQSELSVRIHQPKFTRVQNAPYQQQCITMLGIPTWKEKAFFIFLTNAKCSWPFKATIAALQ